jgi:hypothetical protein
VFWANAEFVILLDPVLDPDPTPYGMLKGTVSQDFWPNGFPEVGSVFLTSSDPWSKWKWTGSAKYAAHLLAD